jgi:hypothetical protein
VVLRLKVQRRHRDVPDVTKFSSQESIDYKDCMCCSGVRLFFSSHDYIKVTTRDAGEKDVETASIETSVVMVDTKATQ